MDSNKNKQVRTKSQRVADLAAQATALGVKIWDLLNVEKDFAAMSDEQFEKLCQHVKQINDKDVFLLRQAIAKEHQLLGELGGEAEADSFLSSTGERIVALLREEEKQASSAARGEKPHLQMRDALTNFLRIPRLSLIERDIVAKLLVRLHSLFKWDGLTSQMIQVMGSPKRVETEQAAMDKISAVLVVRHLEPGIHTDFATALDKAWLRVLVYKADPRKSAKSIAKDRKENKEDESCKLTIDWELHVVHQASLQCCVSFDTFGNRTSPDVWISRVRLMLEYLMLLLELKEINSYDILLPQLVWNSRWTLMKLPMRNTDKLLPPAGMLTVLFPAAVHLVQEDTKMRAAFPRPTNARRQELLWSWVLRCVPTTDWVRARNVDSQALKPIVDLSVSLLELVKLYTESLENACSSNAESKTTAHPEEDVDEIPTSKSDTLKESNFWAGLGALVEFVHPRSKSHGLDAFASKVAEYTSKVLDAVDYGTEPAKMSPPVSAVCWLLSTNTLCDSAENVVRCLKLWSCDPKELTPRQIIMLWKATSGSKLLYGGTHHNNPFAELGLRAQWATLLELELTVNWAAHSPAEAVPTIVERFDGCIRALQRRQGKEIPVLKDRAVRILTCKDETVHTPSSLEIAMTCDLRLVDQEEAGQRFSIFVRALWKYCPGGLWTLLRFCDRAITSHASSDPIMEGVVSATEDARSAAIVELLSRKNSCGGIRDKGRAVQLLTDRLGSILCLETSAVQNCKNTRAGEAQEEPTSENVLLECATIRLQLRTLSNLVVQSNPQQELCAKQLIDFFIDVVLNQVQPYDGSEVHEVDTERCVLSLPISIGHPLLLLGCALDCLADLLPKFPSLVFPNATYGRKVVFDKLIKAVVLHFSARLPTDVATNVISFLRNIAEHSLSTQDDVIQISPDNAHLYTLRLIESLDRVSAYKDVGGDGAMYRDCIRMPRQLNEMDDSEFDDYTSNEVHIITGLVPVLNALPPKSLDHKFLGSCLGIINEIAREALPDEDLTLEICRKICQFVAALCHAMKGAPDFWILKEMYPSVVAGQDGVLTDGIPLDIWENFPEFTAACFVAGGASTALKLLKLVQGYSDGDTIDQKLGGVKIMFEHRLFVSYSVLNLDVAALMTLTAGQRRRLLHFLRVVLCVTPSKLRPSASDTEDEGDEEEDESDDFDREEEDENDEVKHLDEDEVVEQQAHRMRVAARAEAKLRFFELQRQVEELDQEAVGTKRATRSKPGGDDDHEEPSAKRCRKH